MLMSLGACGAAPASSAPQESQAPQEAAPAPAPAEAAAPAPEELPLSDTDKQLALIQSKISTLLQPEGDQPWLYTVTDLDHNGRLEFVAARQHPQDRSKNLLVWEVNTDRSALSEVAVKLEEDETFPDFMTDSTDTYHMAVGDTWSYMFYDNIVLSDTEVFTRKSAMTFKNGTISYEPFAIEHTVVTDGLKPPFDTETIWWYGVDPLTEPHNLRCTGVSRTNNQVVIALAHVDVTHGNHND